MKKIISVILAALMIAGALSLFASAAVNSNHYVEEEYPILAEDDSYWQIYCWTCVDTEITAVGYRLDDGDTVWAVTTVDTRDDNSVVGDNDAFRDYELEAALIEYDLTNGLSDFYGYRIKLTVDLTDVARGKHNIEIMAKYADGEEDNTLRGTVFPFKKSVEAAGSMTTAAAAEAKTEPPVTEAKTEAAPVTDAKTENAAITGEQKPSATEAATEKTGEAGKNNTLVIVLIIIAVLAAAAVAGVMIFGKKAKKN